MKNLLRFGLGSAILAGSTFLAIPQSAEGFTTIGGSLGLGQRDVRLYNNFNGSSANNNNVIHQNWPQYDGAELSMWKGGAEWNARAHGDGTGDSTQGTVGSGEADFSYFWNGNASGVGGSNDNIISSIGGSSGGVLAYAETPISDGWRIRFYGDAWSWQDGPGSVGSGIDIQGVACHELGHTLGLGHTTVNGSTMTAFISGTGTGQRSIQSDDIAGVQWIYGNRSSNMPSIDTVSGSLVPGGTVTLTGSGFSNSLNRIWLQSDILDGGQGGGEKVVLDNISSSQGGTQLSFTLPQTGWEGGSIHVKYTTGSGGDLLSESHPFDADPGGGSSNDTINLTVTDTTPDPGQSVTFSFDNAPAFFGYTLVYSTTDNSPFFATYNGIVASGTVSNLGTGDIVRTIPAAGAGRTAYLEVQVDQLGTIFDSNTLVLNIN
ncbi:MAG: matrixin family metalloprotease [Planctomycetota bacterium]|jgi:hypothetical protein